MPGGDAMTRTAQHRSAFALQAFKALDDAQGTFSGYLAVFDNEDLGGDVIERGAFTKTLNDARERKAARQSAYLFPILNQHDEHQPCGGFVEAHEDEHGLYVKGQLDLDIQLGRDVYSGMKKGYLTGLSIGYSTIKHKWVGNTRRLQELALFEGSPVTFAMNPEASVTAVKAASGKTTWPLGDRDAAWDGAGAHNRIVKWATDSDGNVDAAKLKSVHFWFDDSAPDNITSYKLLFCDVQAGDVEAMPKGIFACAGAHGIETADIPSGDTDAVKAKIAAYYKRMAKEFDDDTLVAPWEAESGDGGKAKSMPTKPKPTSGTAQRKARDFDTLFASLSASDELQDAWGDTFIAFVQCMYEVMWHAHAVVNGYVSEDEMKAGFDGNEAAQANLAAFSKAVMALVAQSLAADFVPVLDCDGDQFLDPDGVNADEDDYYKAASGIRADIQAFRMQRQGKAGRTISADNHAMMTKALGMIGDGHKAIAGFLKANNPANAGDEPPAQTDPTYDPGFGKSARQGTPHTATRAGAPFAGKRATTPQGAGAASQTGQATTHGADNATDDEMAQFRALMVRMRQEANAARAVAS